MVLDNSMRIFGVIILILNNLEFANLHGTAYLPYCT